MYRITIAPSKILCDCHLLIRITVYAQLLSGGHPSRVYATLHGEAAHKKGGRCHSTDRRVRSLSQSNMHYSHLARLQHTEQNDRNTASPQPTPPQRAVNKAVAVHAITRVDTAIPTAPAKLPGSHRTYTRSHTATQ